MHDAGSTPSSLSTPPIIFESELLGKMVTICVTLLVIFQLAVSVIGLTNFISTRTQSRCRNTYTSRRYRHLSAASASFNQPDDAVLDQILLVAIEAANKAGVLIRDNIGARVKYSKTNYKVQ